jgi:hypothetical protein
LHLLLRFVVSCCRRGDVLVFGLWSYDRHGSISVELGEQLEEPPLFFSLV